MSAGAAQQIETPPESTSKKFTHRTDELAFARRPDDYNVTSVYLHRPPKSLLSSGRPWIVTREFTKNTYPYNYVFRHPLTSELHSFRLPNEVYFSRAGPSTLSVYSDFGESYSVDKLFVFPTSPFLSIRKRTFFALYGGGQLQACPCFNKLQDSNPWVKLSHCGGVKFDDIIHFQDKTYVVDRQGITRLLNHYKTVSTISIGKTVTFEPLTPGSGRFGWRKRFVGDKETLYLVVRTAENLFQVFRLKSGLERRAKTGFYWDKVRGFGGNKVLFMARDCYFFWRASRKFPGREYKNCIVFSEAAFPQYGNDCWEFTQSGDRQFSEDDIAVFCLNDDRFAREEDNSGFPKIDWSPPDWILNLTSLSADDFLMHSVVESSSQSESGANDDDEGSDSGSENKNAEVQSDLKRSKTKDEEDQEVIEYDLSSQDQDQGGVESDSDSQDQEDEEMQCDSNSHEKDDEEMHSKEPNIEGDNAALQKDPVMPSHSSVEEEVTRILLRMNSGNGAMEEGTSGKIMTQVVPKASTPSRTESHKSHTETTKFEGLDIRSDLVPTLQKIWQKHGNIIKDSIVRSGDIVARALESLATMVQILEENPVQSLSDSQADYLSSTLSDLRSICFKVYWLVSFVEKALKVHKSKPLVESLNNLSQLSSKVKGRRAILLGELANLTEEENKLKEEMAKVSKLIPFSEQVKLDEPIGAGLT